MAHVIQGSLDVRELLYLAGAPTQADQVGNLGFNDARYLPPADVKHLYVSTLGNDNNPGTITQPFQTIQAAIDAAPAGISTINVMTGAYVEDLVIDGKLNLLIQGFGGQDSHPTEITGTVTIQGAATTRVRFKDIAIKPTSSGPAVHIDGTAGRHLFDNVTIVAAPNENAVVIEGDISNWVTFYGGSIAGSVIADGTPATYTYLYFTNVNSPMMELFAEVEGYVIVVHEALRLGLVHHNAGHLVLRYISSFIPDSNGNAILSTAANSTNNTLFLATSSLRQPDHTYARINKTGTAMWYILGADRDVFNDVLNGPRIAFPYLSADLGVAYAPHNYSPAFDSLTEHLRAIDDALAAANVSKFVLDFDVADWTQNSPTEYEIVIPAATHQQGMTPDVKLYELEAGYYNIVYSNAVSVHAATGDIRILSIAAFAGRVTVRA